MRVVMPVVEYPIARPPEGAEIAVVEGDYGYGHLLADLWEAGEDFCIVEQDIVLPNDLAEALAVCEKHYCAHPYNLRDGRGLGTALGCVRFTSTLISRYPLVGTPWRATHWSVLDGAVDHAMREVIRVNLHVHPEPLIHRHGGETDRPTNDPNIIILWESGGETKYRDLRDGSEWKETTDVAGLL